VKLICMYTIIVISVLDSTVPEYFDECITQMYDIKVVPLYSTLLTVREQAYIFRCSVRNISIFHLNVSTLHKIKFKVSDLCSTN